ncbi:hypothetical protein [Kribbella sp. NPDC048915]|uniref:hypothetical protein n=1 Tax=Kribbella sp. NPDC048915 TaxID=3155148 RepID=UPI0033F6CA93
MTGGAVVLAAFGFSVGTASAAEFDPSPTCSALHPSPEQKAGTLDGFVIEHLPDGLGSPSDFEYEWEDVSFHSRVWETGPDPEGAYKVDLTVKTLRGERLTDLEAVKDFLVEYEEKEPGSWQLVPVKVGGYDGLLADNEVFYFIEPGVAAEVTIDKDRFTDEDLVDTAAGFRPAPTP